MRYTTLLFDLDHTLLDSDSSENLAFERALRAVGVADPSVHRSAYDRINRALWAAVERHEVSPVTVRTLRFERLLAETGIEADPVELADLFAAGLGELGELYPGALDVVVGLAEHAKLGLVTNGLSDVQRARITRLGLAAHFDSVVISAEVGVSKPSPAIFELAFDQLGRPDRVATIMIGDSLSSDIQGGRNAGIATCWYNPGDKPLRDAEQIDHVIAALTELPGVVRGDAGPV
jgi:YjjG family noncanonical pyrimidine nucleotidase